MATPVEIYEAFKDKVGSEAARMLAESIPDRADLATTVERSEDRLRAEMRQLHAELLTKIEATHAKIEASHKETTRWMLGFFAPLWVGVYGVLALVVVNVLKG